MYIYTHTHTPIYTHTMEYYSAIKVITYTHTHTMEYYSAVKRKNAICSNMDGPRHYHTKWSKWEKERQTPYNITYMWILKNHTNELIYKTDSQT